MAIFLWLAACRSQPAIPERRHLAAISHAGTALYIDQLDNRSIMKENPAPQDSKTIFCSFLVGWMDSTISTDQKAKLAREKYFQYDMQKDWVALVKGDSLYPVFFQEKPGLNSQLKEGALVFEIPAGTRPDTLIYKDSFGAWGTRLFVVNRVDANLNRK